MTDIRQYLRSRILPYADIPLDKIGLYTQYTLPKKERIGSYTGELDDLIDGLHNVGYEYNALSASKSHPEKNILDVGSYRRIPEEHPDIDINARILDWSPHETQYHIHVFELEENIEIFSHYELIPDVLTTQLSVERLRTHYKPAWGSEYILGLAETDVLELIDED